MPYALRSAVSFWVTKKCYVEADKGITDAAIDAVTKIVNSGEITLNQQGAYKDPKANLRIPVKLDSDSTPSWTRIPEQAGQSERSDAGFGVFTLLMSWGSSFCRAA